MRNWVSNTKSDVLIRQRNFSFLISAVLLIIVFLQSIILFNKETNTILVPFGLNSQVSISNHKPSIEYMEAITRDIVTTMLNLTPNNVEYAEKTTLSFASGSFYGLLKNQFEEIKKSIISKKFSTIFYPNSIYPDNSNMIVTVDGVLYVYLGQKEVSRTKKSYEIKYDYISGKLKIVAFKEIINDKNNSGK